MKSFAVRLWNSPTITSWGSLAVRMSSAVVILPMALVKFSPGEIAVWQLFSTLFFIILLLDFGLSPTFVRMLAFSRGGATLSEMTDMRSRKPKAESQPNSDTAAEIFATLRWIYPRLSLFILILFSILGTYSLQHPIAQTSNPATTWLAWTCVLVASSIGFWGNAYGAALQGMNSIALLRRWEVATGLAQIISSFIVLISGGGLLALVISYQFWVIFNALRNRQLLKKMHPELFKLPATHNRAVLRVIWPATWRSGVGVLMGQGIIQASGVAYSQMGSPAEVASYLLALRFMTMISQFAQVPFYAKLPLLAELHASGQTERQRSIAQGGMQKAHWIFIAGASGIALAAQPLLSLIGSQTPFVSSSIWTLMTLAFLAERFGAMHLQLYSLSNHIVWHIANGVTGLLMIVIYFISASILHGMAFPVAMLTAYSLFYCIYSARLSYKTFGLTFRNFEIRTSLAPIAVLCLLLTSSHLIRP
jgi:hypothetical protein